MCTLCHGVNINMCRYFITQSASSVHFEMLLTLMLLSSHVGKKLIKENQSQEN